MDLTQIISSISWRRFLVLLRGLPAGSNVAIMASDEEQIKARQMEQYGQFSPNQMKQTYNNFWNNF
jgi:hypothetical protein